MVKTKFWRSMAIYKPDDLDAELNTLEKAIEAFFRDRTKNHTKVFKTQEMRFLNFEQESGKKYSILVVMVTYDSRELKTEIPRKP